MTNKKISLMFLARWLLPLLLSCGALSVSAASPQEGPPPRGPVVVSGVVPDDATRQAILGKVREVYGREHVVDQLGIASTSMPPNWADNVRKIVTPELKNVQRGRLTIAGNNVNLEGEIDSQPTRDRIGSAIVASLNPTYTVSNKLAVTDNPQARINTILLNKIVEFESGSTVLTAAGQQVLNELIPVLKTLDGKKIQVIGHTDGLGLRQANVALSLDRAVAVKNYLVTNQLPGDSIMTAGMGPDQPVTSNDTSAGRAKNRRIEFKIAP